MPTRFSAHNEESQAIPRKEDCFMKEYQRPEMEVEELTGEIALLGSNETPILWGEEEDY